MQHDDEAPGRTAEPISRSRRRARAVALGLAAIYGAYLVAGNLLLNSPLGRSLANIQPEKFVASWSGGWTLYPGQLRVENLKIAGHVRRTVWSVQADSASGRLALLPLFTKEIRFPRVDASGLTGGATRIDIVREPHAPRPGGWTLRFDRIVGQGIRSAYANDFVLQGDGRAEVGFSKTMRGGPVEVLPSTASFAHGTVWHDGKTLANKMAFDGRFAIERHTRTEAHGIGRLGKTDIDLKIEASTAGIAVEAAADGKAMPELTPGPGRLAGRIAWRHGSLEPGTTLALSLPVTSDLIGRQGASQAVASLTADDSGLQLTGHLEPLPGSTLHADADLRALERTVPLSDIGALVDRTSGHLGGSWRFASLAWLPQLMPGSKIIAFDGAGTILADINIADGEVVAGSSLEVPRVWASAYALGNRFEGDARARIVYESVDDAPPRPRLGAVMDEFRISAADSPSQPFVHGHDLRIDAVAEPEVTARNGAKLRDNVTTRLIFKDARVPDLRVYNRYLPGTSLRFENGAGTLNGDLTFFGEDKVGSGKISVAGNAVGLSVAGLALQGDVAIATKLRRAELDTREFNADGSSIALRRVRVLSADGPAEDWWADIALDESRLAWDRPMKFDGRMRLRMKDVGVLMDIYAQRKDLPAWVEKLVNAGEATATGNLKWHGDTLLLQPLEASNERFDVLARLRFQHKSVVGDLFARWGVLSLGIELDNGHRDLHLVRARNWFDGRPALPPP